MWIEAATVASLAAMLWALSRAGVVVASLAVAVAALLQWGLTVRACRQDGLRLRGLVRPLLRVASGCAVMVLAVLAWRHAMGDRLAVALQLPAEVAVGAVVYGGVLWVGARDLVVDAFDALGLSRFLPESAIGEGGTR
ncbi:hypothetical protein MUU75_17925 [Pseudoxanthomonas mexicana]|nr:hypothetical protein [Pseudoxanthomonas mexicana]UOV04926.1 hypothetical protein MUU75_17925 [Pseudoxanthomonas mexicana]